nr:DUF1564 family protein [Leptospira mayottensis]
MSRCYLFNYLLQLEGSIADTMNRGVPANLTIIFLT